MTGCPVCGAAMVSAGVTFENSYPVVNQRCPQAHKHSEVLNPVGESQSSFKTTYQAPEPGFAAQIPNKNVVPEPKVNYEPEVEKVAAVKPMTTVVNGSEVELDKPTVIDNYTGEINART